VYEFSGQEWKEQKYAELWMGSHPSAPSLLGEGTLTEYLKAHNQPELTYLFKILSIQKCLSIQSHPSKS
jgi:mannose-6-phosphate isomerase